MSRLYENTPVRERAERITTDEIHLCVSPLVHECSRNLETASVLSLDEEELFGILTRDAITYTCDACGFETNDEDDAEEHAQECPNDTEHEGEDDTPFTTHHETREAFEHWIVTHWLAKRLEAFDQMVVQTNIGWVWGRETTGQSISMDSVILEIANVIEEQQREGVRDV